MMRNLLFEIGTEELPARFIVPALESIKNFTEVTLENLEISYEEIKVAGTCRRLALFVKNLSEKQKDREEEILGPALNVALDEAGNYTPALLGFAKKQGLDPKDLIIKETAKGKYFCAKKIIPGKNTIEILPTLLLEILQNVYFPKRMRWGDFDFSFGRPIKWLLALYGEEIVPLSVAGVESNRYTKGHTFLSQGEIRLEKADWDLYKQILFKHFVILEVEERKNYTRSKIEEITKDYGKVVIDESLLEENSHLVEYPFPVIGKFSEKFLNLPEKLVITALQEHQRYFYLVDKNKKLLPYFIAVNNNKPKDESVVIKGHERVAKARLEDALFYYERDLKEPLKNRVEKLKGVIYHIKSGTLYDKTLRLIDLCKYLKKELFPDLSEELIEKTVLYAKVDLVTEVVKEFPSLQGYMGAHYLALEGEKEVATAIYEQYLPSPKEETFPETKLGILLSLADKIDHLSALIGAGEKVSGEGDPYGLRRAAYGI
ncbi:MAG: glycine--tRNA ligase subunit beta, partial [Caldimicrobium sp.]